MLINPRTVRQAALAGLIVVVAGIFIGGEAPGAGALLPDPWDKVVHVAAYGTIAMLTGMAFPEASLPMVLLITGGIGGADEIHQSFLSGRQAGLDDWAADWIGGMLTLPMITMLRRGLYCME